MEIKKRSETVFSFETEILSQIAYCFKSIEIFNAISGNLDKEVDPELEANMLAEEIEEYLVSAEEGDEKGVKDATGDIMVVLWGTILKHKLKDVFWNVLAEICDSNMSKFCKTKEEADESVESYKTQGVVAYHEYNNEFGVWVIKRHDGKVLKSINFRKPAL